MISRCPLGLPIRYREDGTTDYTDSAFLTGMLSLFGSEVEKPWLHIKSNLLVRHPVGDDYDISVVNPRNTSRDQLVAWASKRTKFGDVSVTKASYARKWFINKDFLPPHVKAYLYCQAGERVPSWLWPLAITWMFFDLLTHAIVPRFKKVEDQHEINQALCIYHAFGLAKLFLAVHPSPDENMKDYYTRWRDQGEIYEMYLKWKESL